MPFLPVITGLGFITSIGQDRATVLQSLRELRHGFEQVRFFDNPRLPVRVAGTVKGFEFRSTDWRDWRWPERFHVDRELRKRHHLYRRREGHLGRLLFAGQQLLAGHIAGLGVGGAHRRRVGRGAAGLHQGLFEHARAIGAAAVIRLGLVSRRIRVGLDRCVR